MVSWRLNALEQSIIWGKGKDLKYLWTTDFVEISNNLRK